MLWDAEVGGIKDSYAEQVAELPQLAPDPQQMLLVLRVGHTRNVFEYYTLGTKLLDYPKVLSPQKIAWIARIALSSWAESLTWRTPNHQVG
jgi:hypothetical protein